ncbi:MAG: LysE family transporter [Elusimicrobia bacterium]|nr:LysE family transporter [Elusimicrobiota bacterium]
MALITAGFNVFLRGVAAGLVMGLPVGPAGLFCLRLMLRGERRLGMAAGMGVATADALAAFLVAFGLQETAPMLNSHSAWIHFAAGLFFCIMGVRLVTIHPDRARVPRGAVHPMMAYFSGFLMTIGNPVSFLSFAAVFVALKITKLSFVPASTLALSAGVFAGSMALWLALSFLPSRSHRGHPWLYWVDQVLGAAMLIFGLVSLMQG